MKRFIQQFIFLFLLTFIFSSYRSFAHFGSKGPYGGTVSCSIVYDTTVYIGTANGGVFESTNSKLVGWRPRPVGLKRGRITALTHSGKNLYAATADSGIYIFNGYVGSDRYWKKINNGLTTLKIRSLIAIDTSTILAGTDGNGIFKTVDKGLTWTHVSNSTLDGAVITGFIKAGNYVLLSAEANGIFISDNKGDTWGDFNDAKTLNVAGTNALAFDPAGIMVISNKNGLFLTKLSTTAPVAMYVPANDGLPANTAVRSISNNGSVWILGTDKGIYLTPLPTNGPWTAANTGLTTTDINAVVSFQTSLVAGTNGEGIFKANVANTSWTANNFGFNNLKTYAMACKGEAVVVAATEKGVFVSRDLAASYKRANKGLTDSLNVNDLIFFGTKLLAATNSGVFISTDTGANWTPFSSGLNSIPILRLAASASYIYAFDGMFTLFQSSGTTWKNIYSAPQALAPGSLAFFGGKVAVGINNMGVIVGDEKTLSFKVFSTGLTNKKITSLVACKNKLFAGTDGSGVFVTDTAADNWLPTAVTSISHTSLIGLDGSRIEAMATYGGYVFASYKGGLLATSDHGTTWIAGGNQFNLPSYTHVKKIDFVSTRVFVTTEYNGLYSNGLSELPPNGINEQENLIGHFNISPNPSTGMIALDLSALHGNVKQVIVYDQLGKQVATIQAVTPIVPATLTVAPGLYYVQVVTQAGTAVQKVVIE